MTTQTAQIDLGKLAEKMGELCGAARHDWMTADPADVGLNGVPIASWREAYFEGCKDMADAIFSSLPLGHQEAVKETARAAFTSAYDEAAKTASGGEAASK